MSSSSPSPRPPAPPDHTAPNMRQRLDDVKMRIDKLSPAEQKPLQKTRAVSTRRQSIGRALRLGTDFVAGIAVGAFIGFWLDRWLDSSPWMFVLFFLLGTGAGFLNVFRTARQIQAEQAELVRQGRLDLGRNLKDGDDEED